MLNGINGIKICKKKKREADNILEQILDIYQKEQVGNKIHLNT